MRRRFEAGKTWSRAGREDLDRYHKGEQAALGKARGESARQIERKMHEAYRRRLRDAERRGRATLPEQTWEHERGRSITRIPHQPPQPRGPECGGGGFER